MSDFEKFVEPSKPIQVSNLLKSFRFEVPANQRAYSWDKENWVDLWDDLQDVVRASHRGSRDSFDRFHFLGPMFFVPTNEHNVRRILDGQQRLATLAIVETVIYDLLDYKRAQGKISADGAITLGRIHDAIIEMQGGVEIPRIIMGKENSGTKIAFEQCLLRCSMIRASLSYEACTLRCLTAFTYWQTWFLILESCMRFLKLSISVARNLS
jgi:hypothetical protein